MSEEVDPDILWNERLEKLENILQEGFPELDVLELTKVLEDWIFTRQEVSAQEFIRRCFTQALEMFQLETTVGREPADFVEFIEPAIQVFFGEARLDNATVLALISELVLTVEKG